MLTCALMWGLYTQGFFDVWQLTNYILQNISYYLIEVLLFIMLV